MHILHIHRIFRKLRVVFWVKKKNEDGKREKKTKSEVEEAIQGRKKAYRGRGLNAKEGRNGVKPPVFWTQIHRFLEIPDFWVMGR